MAAIYAKYALRCKALAEKPEAALRALLAR